MEEMIMSKTDEIVMKLLHYFITTEGYNPVILHGAKNEIWLEKLNSDFKIVRIVSDYIHNNEQFNYDLVKTKHIIKKLKKKTLSFDMQALSIFVNVGDNVTELNENEKFSNIMCTKVTSIKELKKEDFLRNIFPSIVFENDHLEEGAELFMKLTGEINVKSEIEAKKNEAIFAMKPAYITYTLIFINAILFILAKLDHNIINNYFLVNSNNLGNEFYRIFSSFFLHESALHFLCNMYALYIIGTQLESFIGKSKFLTVYIISGMTGSLLSMSFLSDTSASLGASGAIFGLLGSLLYFGYYYRVYLGSVIKSQIVPIILLNLMIGFTMTGIDNAAHIGGLIGGILVTLALGVKEKTTVFEKINGLVVFLIYIGFLIFLSFVGL